MTDLHTHILPEMDDGAQSAEESVALLREYIRQGIDSVALTPHFSGRRESVSHFLGRREAALAQLQQAMRGEQCPNLILGAEVSWMSQMAEWEDLETLCYQDTRMLLVELPIVPWTDAIFRELHSLEERRGIIPMIAHVDRYIHYQRKKDFDQLLEMGFPVQVSAEALMHFFDCKRALDLLENYEGLLISDCHNMSTRVPNIEKAMKIIEKKLGARATAEIAAATDTILNY